MGRFVLDFWCPHRKLAVEMDGDSHAGKEAHDAERTAVLNAHGYGVIRFRNEEVLTNLPAVLARIAAAANGTE